MMKTNACPGMYSYQGTSITIYPITHNKIADTIY